MLLVVEHGVSPGAIVDFSLNREEESHPLIDAMVAPGADLLRRIAAAVQVPHRGAPVSRHPAAVRGGSARRIGLLLASAASRRSTRRCVGGADASQAGVAAAQPATLAETRFGQERMLLYSIINAVTDPILLTDTEGKLIIANAHAEKLFAAPEDASEGWRRAVSLNNMLFSAALSTSAVTHVESARRELLLVDPLEGSDLLFELLSSRARTSGRAPTSCPSCATSRTCGAGTRGDRGELPDAADRAGGGARRAAPARADHRLGRRPDPRDRPRGGHRADERAGRAAVHRAAGRPGRAQRRVRANGAHLSSFVSNVLTRERRAAAPRRAGLTDPDHRARLPVEGLAGQILSEQGELIWVVTILHDLTEAVEKARLYEQLKRRRPSSERKVQEATAELATRTSCCGASTSRSSRPRRSSRSSSRTCRTSSARR
jgi:PAS domain-containing protein